MELRVVERPVVWHANKKKFFWSRKNSFPDWKKTNFAKLLKLISIFEKLFSEIILKSYFFGSKSKKAEKRFLRFPFKVKNHIFRQIIFQSLKKTYFTNTPRRKRDKRDGDDRGRETKCFLKWSSVIGNRYLGECNS